MGRFSQFLWGFLGGPTSEAAGDPDLAVLHELRRAGTDLSKPIHALFYVYAPTQRGANRIAAAGRDGDWKVEVRPSASGDGNWLCLFEGEIVPSVPTIRGYRTKFSDLAASEGGEYDGWEATVTR